MGNLINCLVLVLTACVFMSDVSRGQFIYGGKCPNHPLQPNFDLSKYMGKWYEIGRTMALFELGYKCVSCEYKLMEEGKMVGIVNSGRNFMKHQVSKGGKGMVDPHRPGRLMVKIGKSPFWSNYNVLKTDYENYAIVWTCSNLAWILHTEILWVLSRKPTLSTQSWSEINDYLKKYKVRTRTYSMTKQANCDFDFYS